MSTAATAIWGNRRTKQLVAAALAGHLRYDADGTLWHRSPERIGIPASRRDAAVVAALIDLRLLRRDESGAVTPAGSTTTTTRSST